MVYALGVVEELPDWLEFLLFVVCPTAAEVLLLVLVVVHFSGEVPTSDDSLHSSSEKIALAFNYSKDRS